MICRFTLGHGGAPDQHQDRAGSLFLTTGESLFLLLWGRGWSGAWLEQESSGGGGLLWTAADSPTSPEEARQGPEDPLASFHSHTSAQPCTQETATKGQKNQAAAAELGNASDPIGCGEGVSHELL